MPPTVLMVAEKPSIAHAIAAALHSNEKTAIRDEGGGVLLKAVFHAIDSLRLGVERWLIIESQA